jgi:CDP-diacylglycerol--glycerol-3-phosphate 3-phosphatidyltransferase
MNGSANLSNDYFTNRQDRYICIPDFPAFAKFFDELLDVASTFSYRLSSELFRAKSTNPFRIHWPSTNPMGSPIDIGAAAFSLAARDSLGGLVRRWARLRPHTPAGVAQDQLDTQLRPFFQMGQLGILDETHRVVPGIFEAIKALASVGATPVLDWTSGYFSLDPANIERILDSEAFVRVVCAAPEVRAPCRPRVPR